MKKEKTRISEKRTNFVVLYSGPPCSCGFGIREKSDAVCGFLVYFCAVLRFFEPPSARTSSVVLLFVRLHTTRKLKTMEMKGRL